MGSQNSEAPCGAEGCFADAAPGGSSSDVTTDIGRPSSPQTDSGLRSNPLCGLGCQPDNSQACMSVPDAGGAATDEDSGSWADGATSGGDEDAQVPNEGAGDNGGANMGGPSHPGSDAASSESSAFDSNKSGTLESDSYSCQVKRDSHSQQPIATCLPAGVGENNDSCNSSADCAPGLACVVENGRGLCRSYCCLDPEGCQTGTYCAERALLDDWQQHPSSPLAVPVCVPTDPCQLLGSQDSSGCPQGLACSVVRNDGTTACVQPGASQEGGSCPCASGYVCSKATNTCMKLCHTADANECESGVCQGGTTGLPQGFGVCVGPSR